MYTLSLHDALPINPSVSFADSSSTALRFGNRPALPSGQSLTGQKGPIRGAILLTAFPFFIMIFVVIVVVIVAALVVLWDFI